MGENFDDAPVGAGPYEFEGFRPGEILSVRRYDGYWDKEHQKLEGVDFIQVAAGVPCIASFGPGFLPRAHSPNESLHRDGAAEAAMVYAMAALDYLGGNQRGDQ